MAAFPVCFIRLIIANGRYVPGTVHICLVLSMLEWFLLSQIRIREVRIKKEF
jgi:hypothetical protein